MPPTNVLPVAAPLQYNAALELSLFNWPKTTSVTPTVKAGLKFCLVAFVSDIPYALPSVVCMSGAYFTEIRIAFRIKVLLLKIALYPCFSSILW